MLQDFIAGQEATIQQYGLQASSAAQGLQVQLCLQQGAAQVQALIQQETHLCKQELMAARLTAPAANATGKLFHTNTFWMSKVCRIAVVMTVHFLVMQQTLTALLCCKNSCTAQSMLGKHQEGRHCSHGQAVHGCLQR